MFHAGISASGNQSEKDGRLLDRGSSSPTCAVPAESGASLAADKKPSDIRASLGCLIVVDKIKRIVRQSAGAQGRLQEYALRKITGVL